MDKIIKTISESGAFRAYVLDSTETVRTAQEKHHTQASSTVALGRTLIASQILAANEKGDTKITVKVLGTSSLGAIITVADTKGNVKGYVQNPGVDIKKTATGEVLVGPFVGNGEFLVITDYGTGNPYNSMTPLVTGEIGEDLAFYLTESQQTPSAVGLNVLLDDEDKVKVAGGFLLQVLPNAKEEEIARFEKRIQEMPAISTLLESEDHIEALLAAIYGDEPFKRLSEEELRFQCDCSRERFLNALASLPASDLIEMKDEVQRLPANSAKPTTTLTKMTWRNSFVTNLNTPFMIGDVEIPNRTVLAPMAGVTNSAFRTIAKELGAGLVVMEMVSDKGIQYNNEKTLHMLHIDEGENPVSIQLFGSDEDSLARAAEFIQENTKTDIVDINMGCPVNKIVKNEAGAMWLKDPDKIYSIINKVQSVLDIPLTVKMRTGWSDPSLAVENALAAEAAGVSALAMHGRTREQMYTGHADLETLHKVAQALTKIPFIANGDIRTVQDAKQRIEEVGADAVMIGRAAMGNPYLFNQINHYFETGEILPDLTFEDKMKIAYEHLKRLIDLKGEHIAVREFRGLAPHYLRGTSGAAKLRGAISQASTLAEIEELLQLNA